MSKVFIIGAAGKVARRLSSQLDERGPQPVALHRKPVQAAELAQRGATPGMRTDVAGSVMVSEDANDFRLKMGLRAYGAAELEAQTEIPI